MLSTRIITATVLLAAMTLAALLSPVALCLGAMVLVMACVGEWLRLTDWPGSKAWLAAGACAALLLWGTGSEGVRQWSQWPVVWVLACAVWVLVTAWLFAVQKGRGAPLPLFWLRAMAIFLCAAAWFALVRLMQDGIFWCVSVLCIVWVSDVAAYGFGRWLGKAKLASKISPGKTWAGVWGAMGVVLLVAHATAYAYPDFPVWTTGLLNRAPALGTLVLCALVILGIVGDLFESAVKRRAGVKDSGTLLPGHGGAWDRLDASLPVLPVAALVQLLIGFGGRHGA
jgi:phosphatidate cytidylyltransferase